MNKREIGNQYENLACSYMEKEGMHILARNYRVRAGEIDIIAMDKDVLVFAEVKYRSSIEYGGAEYAIPDSKKKTIVRVAQWFMASRKIPQDTFCRFDAVLIDGETITYIKNAWQC